MTEILLTNEGVAIQKSCTKDNHARQVNIFRRIHQWNFEWNGTSHGKRFLYKTCVPKYYQAPITVTLILMIYLNFSSKFHLFKSRDKSPYCSIHSFKSSTSCFQRKVYSLQTTFTVWKNCNVKMFTFSPFLAPFSITAGSCYGFHVLKNINAKSRKFLKIYWGLALVHSLCELLSGKKSAWKLWCGAIPCSCFVSCSLLHFRSV